MKPNKNEGQKYCAFYGSTFYLVSILQVIWRCFRLKFVKARADGSMMFRILLEVFNFIIVIAVI
jgi:hypothetical protein